VATEHTVPPAERVGNVLIAETANHLQAVGAIDFFVRDGSYVFADATGLGQAQKRAELPAASTTFTTA